MMQEVAEAAGQQDQIIDAIKGLGYTISFLYLGMLVMVWLVIDKLDDVVKAIAMKN